MIILRVFASLFKDSQPLRKKCSHLEYILSFKASPTFRRYSYTRESVLFYYCGITLHLISVFFLQSIAPNNSFFFQQKEVFIIFVFLHKACCGTH